ncbi:MAG: hypothetical protein ABIV48_03395 [Pyrinomonadaceae bacterium]
MNLLAIALLISCLPSALMDFAIPKWKADKNIAIEDAYKWTFQATRGGEHAAPSADAARKWLAGEWETLGPAKPDEPVWEPLCPDGEIGRLNLRPFRLNGGKSDALLNAFLASSREYRSEGANFAVAWHELPKRLKKKPIGSLEYKAWAKLDGEMKAKNYPAVHHSETYGKANAPAYRILTLAEMKKLLADQK